MTGVAVLVHEHEMTPKQAMKLSVRLRGYWLAVAQYWLEMRTRG